jgi:hypothetical protein
MSIPQSLQDRLRKRQIVPFVGAGVSMNVLDRDSHQPVFPSWRQLLNGAADRLENEMKSEEAELVRALLRIQRPDFLYAAQQAREALGGVWFDFLRQALDVEHERIDQATLELASSIWRLGSNIVITTNYDDVLRWASPHQGDLQSWDIEAAVHQALLLRGELLRPVIWHLHGKISNPSGMILSRDGYELLYPEANHGGRKVHYDAALATLRQLAIAKSFLFVGFSLDDEPLGFQLKSVHEMYKGAGQHFALVQERDADRITNLKMGIDPIVFKDLGDPLLALLKELKGFVPSAAESPEVETKAGERSIVIPDYGPHRPVFYVPFKQKGDEIVGQQDVLADVRKQLTEGKRTAIGQTAAFRGLGGLGKTQLAIEYAYRYRDSYPNGVIWINADQDIDAQLIDIAEKARWIAAESDHKYKIQIAQQRVRSYSECLIVFDNLEDRADIEPYLPEAEANPHILVTSRTDHVGFQPIALDPLNESLSRELLVKEAGREPHNEDEEDAAQGIVALLGGLPLALELAGAYLRHRRSVSFEQYYELLSKDLKSALPKHVESFTKHEADLYSTLRLSEALLSEEPYLRDILDLLTWSGSAPMSTNLMSNLLNLPDAAALTGSLALGAELRLLQRSEKSNSYSLHRLVGEVRRGEIPLETRTQWVDAICRRMGDWFQEKRDDFSELTQFESEVDHLQKWQQNAARFATSHASRLMWLQAYPAYHRGRFNEARNYVTDAQIIFNRLGDKNRALQANLLNDLSSIDDALGYSKLYLANQLEVLAIRRELFTEPHSDIALSLNNIASGYGERGDLQHALQYSELALAMRRALFDEPHSDIATSLNTVGRWSGEQGNLPRAVAYSELALNMRRALFGAVHPDIANSLNSVGNWYGEEGKLKQALDYSQQTLDMYREILGEKHPSVATALSNVGTWCFRNDDLDHSFSYLHEALGMRRELFGERHPDIATSLSNIASWYAKQDDLNRALEYAHQALQMRESLFSNPHPDITNSFNNIGTYYGRQGHFGRAMEYLKRGLDNSRELFGSSHPQVAMLLNNIATWYANQGDVKHALEHSQEALAIQTQLFGEHHPSTSQIAVGVISRLFRLNRRQEAHQLVTHFLTRVPEQDPAIADLKRLEAQLLSTTIRKGFRQQPKHGRSKKKKKHQ